MLRNFIFTSSLLLATGISSHLLAQPAVQINNRPLAKVNEKTITLLDVVKLLDAEIRQYNPEVLSDPTAKYQYYTSQWQRGLEDLIEQELILNEYEEKKLFEISEGDIREEMQRRFGPNIIQSLDLIQMSYEEAKKMVHNELILRQMLWFKAYSKAMNYITPDAVRIAYQAFISQSPPKETWKYRMVTLKGTDMELCKKAAEATYDLFSESKKPLPEIIDEVGKAYQNISLSLSNEYDVEHKNLSPAHQSILTSLKEGNLSLPNLQTTKSNDSVIRLFYLIDHQKEMPKAFEEMADNLKNTLVQKAAEVQKKDYIKRLKQKYHFDESSEKNFNPTVYQPFGLQ